MTLGLYFIKVFILLIDKKYNAQKLSLLLRHDFLSQSNLNRRKPDPKVCVAKIIWVLLIGQLN